MLKYLRKQIEHGSESSKWIKIHSCSHSPQDELSETLSNQYHDFRKDSRLGSVVLFFVHSG
jgi:hypothetical protein